MRNTEIFRTFMDCPDNSAYEYRSLSLMAAADRIQHANKFILPALRQGKVVICDRYIYSCLANLRARGYINDEWIYEISESIPKPDMAFFLDLPVETAVHRVKQREKEKDRYIDIQLQYRLKDRILRMIWCGRTSYNILNLPYKISPFIRLKKIVKLD
jgi:dTMP kinase